MEHAIIQQRVNCIFGDDHLITAEVGEDNTLRTVGTTCSSEAKEETEGLILLGTDPMKTCLGYRDAFLKHVNSNKSSYNQKFPNKYKGTLLHLVGSSIHDKIREKKSARAAIVKAEQEAKAVEATTGFVCEMFKSHALGALGRAAGGLIFTKQPDNTFTASVVTKARSFNYTTRTHEGEPSFVVADRVKGEWVIRRGALADGAKTFGTLDYGGQCIHCQAKGNRNHNHSVKHYKTTIKNIMIALQATSAEGVRLTKSGITDKNGDPVTFTYRANMKPEKLIGVRLAPREHY